MGETNGDNGQYLLLIPKNVLHGFCVVSKKPAILLNFPTRLYDPNDEGRIPHKKLTVKFADGTRFTWKTVLEQFK